VAHRREHASGHGVAQEAASEHQESERVRKRSKTGREEERESEVRGAEPSGEERPTSASNGHRRRPYHGEQVRALAARGRNGVVAKMEAPLVQRGGRNARLRRARAGGGEEKLVGCCCEGEAKRGEEE
jgi:hypothetical protein